MKDLLKLGLRSMDSPVRAVFNFWKASSAAVGHCIISGWPFFVRSERGAATEEKKGTKQQ